MPVEFRDVYKIGISKIDNQHKELFSIFNQLEYELKINEGGYLNITLKTQSTLSQWIQEHIQQADKRYGKYLLDRINGNI